MSNAEGGDNFGYSVAISGNYAIVGARYEDDSAIITNSGAAYIFERTIGTTGIWTQVQTVLKASTPGKDDSFGGSVAISGNYAIVGAEYEDTSLGNSGAAYIFERNISTDTWVQVPTMIKASPPQSGDQFGTSVAISGNYVVVGELKGNNNAGSAYIFESDVFNTT